MTKPVQPARTARNRPPMFDESLASAIPGGVIPARPESAPASDPPAAAPARRGITHRQARIGLTLIWAAAAIAGGIGAGRLVSASLRPAVAAEAPAPVATAAVAVAPAISGQIAGAVSAEAAGQDSGKLAPTSQSQSVAQAQAGSPFSTIALATFQAAQPSDSLMPGYNHFGHSQGNIGTVPVR